MRSPGLAARDPGHAHVIRISPPPQFTPSYLLPPQPVSLHSTPELSQERCLKFVINGLRLYGQLSAIVCTVFDGFRISNPVSFAY